MKAWSERISIGLLACAAAIYVAAKVHFFTRFHANDIDTYIAEHWPYWLALSIIAGLVLLVARLEHVSRGQDPE